MKGNPFSHVILLACLGLATAEFFSSIHESIKLAEHEQFLLHKMEKFVALNENKLDFLREKLKEFESEYEGAVQNKEFLEDPINKYLLTKSLSSDWERLETVMDNEVGISTLRSIYNYRRNNSFPDGDDFNGAIEGLLRLHKVYRLNAKDMAQGILRGVKYSSELSADACYDIGLFALEHDNLLAAHAWLTEALERFDSYEPSAFSPELEKPDILEALAEVKFKLGDFIGATALAYSLTLGRPDDPKALEIYTRCMDHAYTKTSYNVESEHEPIPDDLNSANEFTHYELTCSGHIHRLPEHERELRCRYLTKNHPFLKLAPFKVEELHQDPQLLLFHDVISDSEIKKFIELANERIDRAKVLTLDGLLTSPYRTSQFAFIENDADDKVLQIVNERISDMTGLNMDVSEDPQVANYGIGGHYAQHHDFFYVMDEGVSYRHNGNRIATVMFYLSDVEQGGGTAFPWIKKLVEPKKGAALFWYNLHASGDGDTWIQHGACPVLVGNKWVLNLWIRERGQEFKRPCGFNTDAWYNSFML